MSRFRTYAALAAVLLVPCVGDAAFIPEFGGQTLATAQLVPTPQVGNPTIITRGTVGDATWMASGLVTTAPGGAWQDLSFYGGAAGGNFTLATVGIFAEENATAELFGDATFTVSTLFDDDDGPGLYPQFGDGEAALGPYGDAHIRFGEYGSNAEITYGYDILSTTGSNGLTIDFFRIEDLAPGSTFQADLQSDGATYGFFDGYIRILDSAGNELAGADDSPLGSRANHRFAKASATVPADGIAYVAVHPRGDDNYDGQGAAGPGGTYTVELAVVPEPGTLLLAVSGLLTLAFYLRRRKA